MRPGVYVEESALPRVIEPSNIGISAGAFIGTALMGPTRPSLVASWSQFVSTYGSFSGDDRRTSLAPAVYQFFANGGGVCYVCRVLAGDAETANVTLVNEDGDNLMVVSAISPGYWGNGLSVDILHPEDIGRIALDPGNRTGPFSADFAMSFDRPMDYQRPLVRLDGTRAPVFTLVVRSNLRGSSVVVERFTDVTLDPNDPRYALRIVNDSSVGSNYVVLQDLTNGTAFDDTPASVERVPLSNGSDGQAPIGANDYVSAMELFEQIEGNLVFNIPGEFSVAGIETAVQERGDSFLVVDGPNYQDIERVITSALPTSSYSAVYYPWIGISDPDPGAQRGAIKWVPPGGSVVGMMLRTDSSRGSFKAPAGVGATLTGSLAVIKRLSNRELDRLNGYNVNAIRPVPGSGITVMGARTRDFRSIARYISVRRTLNYIKYRAAEASRFALFEPNTPALWEQLRVVNGAFLSELWQQGGLAGRTINDGFYVKVDSDNNTAQTIANGEVHIEIGVAPVFPAEFVIIRLGQFEADASFVITEEA